MDEYVFDFKPLPKKTKQNRQLTFKPAVSQATATSMSSKRKHANKNNLLQQEEAELLQDSLYSQLYLDEWTGALYFNLGQQKQQQQNQSGDEFDHLTPLAKERFLYAKVARLVQFYYYERGIASKLVRVEATIDDQENDANFTDTLFLNLIFKKEPHLALRREQEKQLQNSSSSSFSSVNEDENEEFRLNSDNLLDLLTNGDELVAHLNVAENAATWLPDDNEELMHVRKYLESRVDPRKAVLARSILEQVRFYADQDNGEYFRMDDHVNGILLTAPAIQFDYEVAREYHARVKIVQHKFVYWLDVHVHVVNVVDEPFVCSQPVYTVHVDEGGESRKQLLTLDIVDFDSGVAASLESRFVAHIVSGNAQGLFDMSELSLYAGGSARKLDRETRAQHELVVKIIETPLTKSNLSLAKSNGTIQKTRFATCKIVVNVDDINDNR